MSQPIDVPESEYTGPVYFDGAWNGGYLQDTDDFRDWWHSAYPDDVPLPATVWACTVSPVLIPPAVDIIEQATQDSYDAAYDDMTANGPLVAALQQAIDAFNAAHNCQAFDVDYSRRVVLGGAR